MTDKWKLLKLLGEFGIEFKEDRGNIVLETGGTKVDGYDYFFIVWEFDKEDVFQGTGIWE